VRCGCLLCDNVIGGASYRVNAPPTRQRKLSAMSLLALAAISHTAPSHTPALNGLAHGLVRMPIAFTCISPR
jgi:hypothetical protein